MEKENQKKLKKIRKIMNLCCDESLSVDRYTIEECKTEDGMYLLMFVYNADNEIIEARLSSYDNMITIAEKIRWKTQTHISQCNAIEHLVAKKYDTSCIVEVLHYKNDVLRTEIELPKQGNYRDIIDIRGTYRDIMDNLLNR